MIEDDRTEFKSSWADKYLRNVAALANTGGGRLYVGVDDHGDVVGVDDIVRLLKLIPDKIQTTLGIIPTVRHLTVMDWTTSRLISTQECILCSMMEASG